MSFLESCFRFDKLRKEEDRLATKEKCASLDEDASKMNFPYGNSTVIACF